MDFIAKRDAVGDVPADTTTATISKKVTTTKKPISSQNTSNNTNTKVDPSCEPCKYSTDLYV